MWVFALSLWRLSLVLSSSLFSHGKLHVDVLGTHVPANLGVINARHFYALSSAPLSDTSTLKYASVFYPPNLGLLFLGSPPQSFHIPQCSFWAEVCFHSLLKSLSIICSSIHPYSSLIYFYFPPSSMSNCFLNIFIVEYIFSSTALHGNQFTINPVGEKKCFISFVLQLLPKSLLWHPQGLILG